MMKIFIIFYKEKNEKIRIDKILVVKNEKGPREKITRPEINKTFFLDFFSFFFDQKFKYQGLFQES